MAEFKNPNPDMSSSSLQMNRQLQKNWLKLIFSVDDSPLLPAQQTEVTEYWSRLSNGRYQVDPIYCKFYTERTGRFDPRYIPDDFQYDFLENRTINFDYVKAFTDKNYTDLLFSGVKAPEAVVRCVNGAYLDKNFKAISKEEALSLLEAEKYGGIIKRASCDNNAKSDIRGNSYSTKENLLSMLSYAGGNNFVIQKAIKQHKDMVVFGANTSTFIRILSVRNTKSVIIISAVACISDHGITVRDKDVGEIYCGIDKLGNFKSKCFNYKGMPLDKAVIGTKLEGREIKPYERMLQIVREYHEKLPQFGVAAWDFMVDENSEPVFIGYNVGKADIHFHQLCNGPLYGEMTDALVAAAFGNRAPAKRKISKAESPSMTELNINMQPKSASCAKGEKAVFSVAASGEKLKYQWYYRISESGAWTKSGQSDAVTAALTVEAKSYRDGYQYRCKITDASGNTAHSSAATLTVIK